MNETTHAYTYFDKMSNELRNLLSDVNHINIKQYATYTTITFKNIETKIIIPYYIFSFTEINKRDTKIKKYQDSIYVKWKAEYSTDSWIELSIHEDTTVLKNGKYWTIKNCLGSMFSVDPWQGIQINKVQSTFGEVISSPDYRIHSSSALNQLEGKIVRIILNNIMEAHKKEAIKKGLY